MSQENVDLAYRFYDAVNRRDLDAWLAVTHQDAELISILVSVEGGYHGHALSPTAPKPRPTAGGRRREEVLDACGDALRSIWGRASVVVTIERPSNAPPEDAWALLARPDRWHKWAPHVRGAWGLGDAEVEAGRRGFVRLLGAVPVPSLRCEAAGMTRGQVSQ